MNMTVNEEEDARDERFVQVGPYITPAQKERLRIVSFEKRISVSEIVRRALDSWFDQNTN